jgi:hypothetical protein
VRRTLLALVACGASAAPAPKTVAPDALLASIEPLHPFEVVIGGPGTDSLFEHRKCGRSQWTAAVTVHGVDDTPWDGQSSQPTTLIAGDRHVAIPADRLRMYTRATFQHDYTPGDRDTPAELAKHFTGPNAPAKIHIYEFCLVPGRRYHAITVDDQVVVPTAHPTSHDPTTTRRVIVLNDESFDPASFAPGPKHAHW